MEHVCLFARKKSAHKKKDITKKEGVNQSVTKYDSIKNQGKCIDKNAFDIAIKVFVQKYMVLALKEIVSKTVIMCVSQYKSDTYSFYVFSSFRIIIDSAEKTYKISRDKFRGESYLRGIFTRNHLLFIFIFL